MLQGTETSHKPVQIMGTRQALSWSPYASQLAQQADAAQR
jgi:hypothetical protein